MTPDQIDAIARAGYEATDPFRKWDQIDGNERQLWRLATPHSTPRTVRLGRFTGYTDRLDWEDLPPKTRNMWRHVSAAINAERDRLSASSSIAA